MLPATVFPRFDMLVLGLGRLIVVYDAWRSAVTYEEASSISKSMKRCWVTRLPAFINRTVVEWSGGAQVSNNELLTFCKSTLYKGWMDSVFPRLGSSG